MLGSATGLCAKHVREPRLLLPDSPENRGAANGDLRLPYSYKPGKAQNILRKQSLNYSEEAFEPGTVFQKVMMLADHGNDAGRNSAAFYKKLMSEALARLNKGTTG